MELLGKLVAFPQVTDLLADELKSYVPGIFISIYANITFQASDDRTRPNPLRFLPTHHCFCTIRRRPDIARLHFYTRSPKGLGPNYLPPSRLPKSSPRGTRGGSRRQSGYLAKSVGGCHAQRISHRVRGGYQRRPGLVRIVHDTPWSATRYEPPDYYWAPGLIGGP